jgi:hypothetical protein
LQNLPYCISNFLCLQRIAVRGQGKFNTTHCRKKVLPTWVHVGFVIWGVVTLVGTVTKIWTNDACDKCNAAVTIIVIEEVCPSGYRMRSNRITHIGIQTTVTPVRLLICVSQKEQR